MKFDPAFVIDIAVRRGLLTHEEASVFEIKLASTPVEDPIEWLLAEGGLDPGSAGALREAVGKIQRQRTLSVSLVQEGLLTEKAAGELNAHMISLTRSDRIPSLADAAGDLELPVEEELRHRLSLLQGRDRGGAEGKQLVLGHYEILEQVGTGGCGEVYRGVDRQLERVVAIKKILGQDNNRFLQEAQATARLQHSNIVPIFDMGSEGKYCYLILQFVEGFDLNSFVEEQDPGADKIVELFLQVADAVSHAHENHVLHRDLKPENILVENRNKAYVTDFGLAREKDSDSRVTVPGVVMGTPCYMSPEQAGGRLEDVDERSDIYSLGATLYAALTKRPPFQEGSLEEILHAVRETPPPSPRSINPLIPRDLETICLKAMAKEPGRRYESAGQMSEDLKRFQDGEPILARRPSVVYKLRKWAVRRKVPLGAALVVLVLFASGWWGLFQLNRFQTLRQAGEKARTAYRQGEWAKAHFEAERVLEIRYDSEIVEIRDESLRNIKTGEARQKLQVQLRPLQEMITDTRPYFYVKGEDILSKLKRVTAALAELEPIMLKPENENFVEGWRTLGMGYYFVGDVIRAERALLRARKLVPDDGRANFYLGKIYLDLSFYTTVGMSLRSQDSVLDISELPSGIFREDGKKLLAAAEACFSDKVKSWPGAMEIEKHLIKTYLACARGQLEESLKLCREGPERFGNRMGTEVYWFFLSVLPVEVDRREALMKALEIRPHYPAAFINLSRMDSDAAEEPGRQRRYKEAIALCDQAIHSAGRAVALNPRSIVALNCRGGALKLKGDFVAATGSSPEAIGLWDRAEADYGKAIELDPGMVWTYFTRGVVRGKTGNWKGAIEDYGKVIRKFPNFAQSYTNLGYVFSQMGDPEGALRNYEKAIGCSPPDPKAYYNRGDLRCREKNYKGALEDFAKAIDLSPTYRKPRISRADTRRILGDIAGAVEDLNVAVRLFPRDAETLLFRGRLHYIQGHLDKAIKDYDRAIDLQPRYDEAYFNRGNARRKKGEVEKALKDYGTAIGINPRYGNAYMNRAILRYGKGDFQGALKDIDTAIQVSPPDWRNRGSAEQARESLRREIENQKK